MIALRFASESTGFSIAGTADGDQMGTEISTEGDFNGDGINDLLVTARTNDTAVHNAGAAYIIPHFPYEI